MWRGGAGCQPTDFVFCGHHTPKLFHIPQVIFVLMHMQITYGNKIIEHKTKFVFVSKYSLCGSKIYPKYNLCALKKSFSEFQSYAHKGKTTLIP